MLTLVDMEDVFIIYINPLKKGKVEAIDLQIPPDFLEVSEEGLSFNHPVRIKGEAYVADDDLILHLDLDTKATLPCSICNDPVDVEVTIRGFYYVEPLADIKSGVYNMRETIREAVLLDTPSFVECNEGSCPQRKQFEKYIRHSEESGDEGENHSEYHPFKDLALDDEEEN